MNRSPEPRGTGLLALSTFACAVRPANMNKASKPSVRPASRERERGGSEPVGRAAGISSSDSARKALSRADSTGEWATTAFRPSQVSSSPARIPETPMMKLRSPGSATESPYRIGQKRNRVSRSAWQHNMAVRSSEPPKVPTPVSWSAIRNPCRSRRKPGIWPGRRWRQYSPATRGAPGNRCGRSGSVPPPPPPAPNSTTCRRPAAASSR